jgi:hypothetical protein
MNFGGCVRARPVKDPALMRRRALTSIVERYILGNPFYRRLGWRPDKQR